MAELTQGTGYEINPSRVESPDLQFLYDYWRAKCGERPMPSRADFSLTDLRKHLGWVSFLDVLPGGEDFRYRLIGTKITFYFGADTTGKTVTEAFAAIPDTAAVMLSLLRQIAVHKIAVRTWGNLSWMGRELEDFELLFLPCSDDGENVNMIMNPFVFDHTRLNTYRQLQRTNSAY